MVCSGNTCRSPMAAALLARHLEERGVRARVRSAGTLAWGGPATEHAVEVLAERGVDLAGHRSRQLTAELIRDVDLVLGMTRDHVGRVVALDPGAHARAFLLGEAVRLGPAVGPRRPAQPVRAWAAQVAARRPRQAPPGRAGDEVRDPVTEGLAVYRRTADRLDALTGALAGLLASDTGSRL